MMLGLASNEGLGVTGAEAKGTMMNTETETLIAVLQDRMEKMTPAERLALVQSLLGDYCAACGFDNGGRTCHCTNDD